MLTSHEQMIFEIIKVRSIGVSCSSKTQANVSKIGENVSVRLQTLPPP